MRIFHFIKYNDNTSLDDFVSNTNSNTVFCFDFEDSIQDCINPLNNPILKRYSRNCFKTIVHKCKPGLNQIKIGIRINSTDSGEYLQDIDALVGIRNISAIFLPKISSAEQIWDLQNRLQRKGVSYNEIVPVIETKTGLNNLESILKIKSKKINSIAFGHCDYNLDNAIYPFFHQQAREYWTWVTKIVETIKPYHLSFVNSPFLELNNDLFFNEMLSVLYSICGNNFGQITLTHTQSEICNSFSFNKINSVFHKITNTLDLRTPELYATEFIESFEKNSGNRGFTINKDRTILSPHEYYSSINYLNNSELPEINFTFVGGCFPVQSDILFENLFHQLLKREIENMQEVKFNVNIIRYERYRNCLRKISNYNETKQIDILAFSIRPEPFLRLVKLYYRFFDDSTGRKRWSLNLPFLNKVNPEKYDLLSLDTRFYPAEANDRSIIRKALINLNYILGSLLGNYDYALRESLRLANEVIDFSKRNNIQLIIMGPPIRTNTLIERILSKNLDRFIRKSLSVSADNFVGGSDLYKDGEPLFKKGGIYANEKYHELIAERMLKKIMNMSDKFPSSDITLPKVQRKWVTAEH